jgi:hypothetical protein
MILELSKRAARFRPAHSGFGLCRAGLKSPDSKMGYKNKARSRPDTGSRVFGPARFLKKKTGPARKPESPYRAGLWPYFCSPFFIQAFLARPGKARMGPPETGRTARFDSSNINHLLHFSLILSSNYIFHRLSIIFFLIKRERVKEIIQFIIKVHLFLFIKLSFGLILFTKMLFEY